MENKELVDYLREYKAEKVIKAHRLVLISNIILIAFVIAIGAYIFFNIEEFKTIGQNVCALCMNRTGAICLAP
jgi:hypothetical protein